MQYIQTNSDHTYHERGGTTLYSKCKHTWLVPYAFLATCQRCLQLSHATFERKMMTPRERKHMWHSLFKWYVTSTSVVCKQTGDSNVLYYHCRRFSGSMSHQVSDVFGKLESLESDHEKIWLQDLENVHAIRYAYHIRTADPNYDEESTYYQRFCFHNEINYLFGYFDPETFFSR